MGRLIIDHNFVAFSEDVGREIFRTSKSGRKHPARCINGGEPFEINGVRSLGPSHQVRKRVGGNWIKLLPGAVVEWLSPNGVYGSDALAEQIAEAGNDAKEPDDTLHRIHTAVQRLQEASKLVDEAARKVWGLKGFEPEYEYLTKDSRLLDIAQKKIKQRFTALTDLAHPVSPPDTFVSKQSEVCPCCAGWKEVGLPFCSDICWPKLPKELRKSLKNSVGAVYEEAFGEALYLLGVEDLKMPASTRGIV